MPFVRIKDSPLRFITRAALSKLQPQIDAQKAKQESEKAQANAK
jgi:hypothetical protein